MHGLEQVVRTVRHNQTQLQLLFRNEIRNSIQMVIWLQRRNETRCGLQENTM